MNPVDRFSYLLHLAIAEKLRLDGDRVLRVARKNIQRWLASGRFKHGAELPLLEWQRILDTRTSDEIIRLISLETDEGQRLRSSSPFTGIISEAERDKIWSECAEIGFA